MIRQPRFVLASASPRRHQLLPLLGYPFRVQLAAVDERPQPGEAPLPLALRLARAKAAALDPAPDELVLAADTVVVLDGALLGKPADADEARRMLLSLRGRAHQVITAVALRAPDGTAFAGPVSTDVWMRRYDDAEIEAYIARGEPFDKAGAYAVQDRAFRPVERLVGCHLAVIGLPLCEVARGLRALGCAPVVRLAPLVPPCALCRRGDELTGISPPAP